MNHRNNRLYSQYLDSQLQQASFTIFESPQQLALFTVLGLTATTGFIPSFWTHRDNRLHSQYLDPQKQQASFTVFESPQQLALFTVLGLTHSIWSH
jgi:hypothetical protein